jgi:adenosylcobinamide hydrolase
VETLKNYLDSISKNLCLESSDTTGLMTTASMENASLEWAEEDNISIFALITAGAGTNAVRAGDPPCYHEEWPDKFTPVAGTINILLTIEAKLPEETLARIAIMLLKQKLQPSGSGDQKLLFNGNSYRHGNRWAYHSLP